MQEEQRTVETTTTEQSVDNRPVNSESRADGAVVIQRIIWYIAGFIITMLALRLVLLMLAANQGNAFVDLIYAISGFFAWPFFGIFGYQPTYGEFTFELSTVVAIVVYALAAWGLARAFTLTGRRAA